MNAVSFNAATFGLKFVYVQLELGLSVVMS
jgi:hypothetical protein